jgi:hypothetical protein
MTQQMPVSDECRQRGFIVRHWRGELSLARSCWINGALIGIVWLVLIYSASMASLAYVTNGAALLAGLRAAAVTQLVVLVWQMVGIGRSSVKHVRGDGRRVWTVLAWVGLAISVPIVALATYMHCDAIPARFLTGRGDAKTVKGEYDQAIVDYDLAIRFDPYYSLAYYGRGEAYGHRGDLDRAIASFDEAIRLYPNFALAHVDRCAMYLGKGEAERAVAECGEAIKLNTGIAVAYLNRGTAYALKGDNDLAIADYDQALRLDPNNARAKRGRAIVLDRKRPPPWPVPSRQ